MEDIDENSKQLKEISNQSYAIIHRSYQLLSSSSAKAPRATNRAYVICRARACALASDSLRLIEKPGVAPI